MPHAPQVDSSSPATPVARLARPLVRIAGLCVVAALLGSSAALAAAPPAPSFAHFVDSYLDRFGSFHPSIAAGNGLHGHDGHLEDFSAAAIAVEVRWLRNARRGLEAFDPASLSPDERADREVLAGIIDGWLLDLDTVRTWQRNPMVYVAAISDGMHNLATMDSAPAEVRMRHALSKLQPVASLLHAARVNIKNPPQVFVERAIAMLDGVSDLLMHDLALAFPANGHDALREQLLSRAASVNHAILAYRKDLQTHVEPSAHGSFVIGTANLEARYRAEELIDLPASQLLAIGERELAREQREFEQTALRIDPAKPAAQVWEAVQGYHPDPGQLVPAAGAVVSELFAFIDAHQLMKVPPAEQHVVVAPAPAYDLGLASMHSSPPLEPHPVKSYYYITDVDSHWPAERQQAWLRTLNYATLADISAHEVAPGHYVHSLYMRHTPGKIRRIWVGLNPFPQPSSGQDGWAHYAEQMVSDEGFHGEDPRYRLAMLAESLNRICRLITGIRLHSGEWTIEQATQLFEREAHLPAAAARREAVRGTYDPTYGGYTLGKMAALKLRADYQAAKGAAYSLQDFHERVMTDGIAPWKVHRELLLPGDAGAVLE
ncbi:MAG: DUF885 domain-containing protein [Proteobacteria bacterium]|nr:DUF885 domain-containing protein [Pseudomonadota bacterium]